MTNQMRERIYLIQNPDMEVDEDNHIIWSSSPDIYEQQQVVGEYTRADLAQKTVTREELAVLVWETLNFYFDPKDIGGCVADALIAAGVVNVTDEK